MPFHGNMPKAMSEEVPFVEIKGRRALTREQLQNHPELAQFVRSFPDSFEYAMDMDVVFFIEPDDVRRRN